MLSIARVMKWTYDVGSIIRQNRKTIALCERINNYQKTHLYNLSQCRTAQLGGHIHACNCCRHYTISYNSCRNRHCPSCQSLNREMWVLKQEKQLLPVSYFHVVFTIPHELNGLCLRYPRLLYQLLFKCSWETIQAFASDNKYLGAKTGMTAVLHTWGQNLMLHPHLHCIIPGGGITPYGKWKTTRSNGKYLFPKTALRKVFKGKFMAHLKALAKKEQIILPNHLRETLYQKTWVVYAKQPFLGPKQVIEYLGRYTHKVAISNYRIKSVTNDKVTFNWKNYTKGGQIKPMSLHTMEFIRRFSLHFLPKGFTRMRHYGILSSRGRASDIPLLQQELNVLANNYDTDQLKNIALSRLKLELKCKRCVTGMMELRIPFGRAGPGDHTDIQKVILNHVS